MPQHGPGDPRAAKVILRFAAVVVEQHSLAKKASDQDCRKRCEQKGRVRRREDVYDIRTSQFPDEQRPVAELSHNGPQVLHAQ
jgi:hypothetical protein